MAVSLFIFIAITLSCTIIGVGLLQLFRIPFLKNELLIAPSIFLSSSSIVAAVIVQWGFPLQLVSKYFWLCWILLGVLGVKRLISQYNFLEKNLYSYSLIIAGFMSWGYIQYGIFDFLGSPALDGWSYMSFGEYLLRYSKGTEGGLLPLYQYASHLSQTRYVASAILGLMIPPVTGLSIDTQMMSGPFIIMAVFSYTASLIYAGVVLNNSKNLYRIILLPVIGVIGGWVAMAIRVNNFDNLLSLSIAPLLYALACDREIPDLKKGVLVAISLSASIYIYPELAPLIISGYISVGFFDLLKIYFLNENKKYFFKRLLYYLLIVLAVGIIISPYLKTAIQFFLSQLTHATQAAERPGAGIYPALINFKSMWGAFWGFSSYAWGNFTGVLTSLVLLIGLLSIYKDRSYSLILCFSLTIILFLYMAFVKSYDYGAYKILLINWWVIAIALTAGFAKLFSSFSNMLIRFGFVKKATTLVRIFIALFFCLITYVWIVNASLLVSAHEIKSTSSFRAIRDLIKSKNVLVDVAVSDPLLNSWMVYYLRDGVYFREYAGYMNLPHVRPLMERSESIGDFKPEYLLLETRRPSKGEIVWQDNKLKLIKGLASEQR